MKKKGMIVGILIAVLSMGFMQEASAQHRNRNRYRQQRMERVVVTTPRTRVVITEPRYRAHYQPRVAYRMDTYRQRRFEARRYRRAARWNNARYSYNRPCHNPDRYMREGNRW